MMQLLYDMKAQRAGIYIISGCGFNSICNDMGTVFLQHNFEGNFLTNKCVKMSIYSSTQAGRSLEDFFYHPSLLFVIYTGDINFTPLSVNFGKC